MCSGSNRLRVNMQKGRSPKLGIIRLLEGRSDASLENIRQFILDLDELEHIEFLYPLNPAFGQELDDHAAEAKIMLENLRDIEGTLRDLGRGKIRIQ